MQYKNFTWPQPPEQYSEEAERTALYAKDEDGVTQFKGLGPVCRKIVGSGAFTGTDAYTNFEALQALLAEATPGQLDHGTMTPVYAYFTGLRLTQEPRQWYVAYEFTFLEADSEGNIPNRTGGLEEVSEAGGGVIVLP